MVVVVVWLRWIMETGQVRFRNKQHRTIAQRTGIHGGRIKKETSGRDNDKRRNRNRQEEIKQIERKTTRKREQREERESERKRGAGIEEVPRGAHRRLTAGSAGRIVSSVSSSSTTEYSLDYIS